MNDVIELAGVMAVLLGTVLGGWAGAVAVWRWQKSGERKGATQSEIAEVNERLARLEQAVETIAVEMERVSEGQRFATKLLAERGAAREGAALAAASAAPPR